MRKYEEAKVHLTEMHKLRRACGVTRKEELEMSTLRGKKNQRISLEMVHAYF